MSKNMNEGEGLGILIGIILLSVGVGSLTERAWGFICLGVLLASWSIIGYCMRIFGKGE